MGLLERLAKVFGLNPIQLRWRWTRFRERMHQSARSLENRSRTVTYRHKVCVKCGLTLDAKEPSCPRCGKRQPGLAVRRLAKIWRLLIPEGTYTYSSLYVLTCIAFYLAMLMKAGGLQAVWNSLPPHIIISFGAWTVPQLAQGEVWRLVTPIFLHFSPLHLIFNCLWLLQLGPLVEQRYGRSRYLVICLFSGVSGFAVSVLYRWDAYQYLLVPGGGASGVVFGLIAVALVVGYTKKHQGAMAFREGLVKWALYGLIFSFLPGIDLAAHLGGAGAGALAGWLMADQQQSKRWPDILWLIAEVVCLVIIFGSFALVIRTSLSGGIG